RSSSTSRPRTTTATTTSSPGSTWATRAATGSTSRGAPGEGCEHESAEVGGSGRGGRAAGRDADREPGGGSAQEVPGPGQPGPAQAALLTGMTTASLELRPPNESPSPVTPGQPAQHRASGLHKSNRSSVHPGNGAS